MKLDFYKTTTTEYTIYEVLYHTTVISVTP